MKVLLIDNYDSFTYNLAHQLYRITGTLPMVYRNDEITTADIELLDPDAIVLSPGPGDPAHPSDVGVCDDVLGKLTVPVLGVCLGFQALVWSEGGQVTRTHPVHGRTSSIRHSGTDLFAGLPPEFAAVRYHSLAAGHPLPDGLELTAWTEDGIPMGVRHRTRPAWGVQFHPESICTEHGDRLMQNFLHLASADRTSEHPRPDRADHRCAVAPAPAPVAQRPLRVRHRRLDRWCDPETAFLALCGDSPRSFWLDSSQTGTARYSFLGSAAQAPVFSYDVITHRTTVERGAAVDHRAAGILDVLDDELAARSLIDLAGFELPFVGGFVGYFGYETGADCADSTPVRPASVASETTLVPDACWMLIERFVAFDHVTRAVHLVAVTGVDDQEEGLAWLDASEQALAMVDEAPPREQPAAPPTTGQGAEPVQVTLDRPRWQYLADIAAAQDAIRAGQSYELCLTAQATTAPISDPLDFYRVLRRVSPAPYAAYLRFGDVHVLSSSPERFLEVSADQVVTSRPMKGTAARSSDPYADQRARETLSASVKDRAENLMIVDLLRNDLGRVCEPDSVAVPGLMDVETYATVHQMVSTVTGRLAATRGVIDCIRAAFPGGSMTGAPKQRSMQILHGLEPRRRGVYSGTLGYLGFDGRADLNIVIRTAIATPTATTLGVGGAITVLSDPEAEFDEIVLKAQGILRALMTWRGYPLGNESIPLGDPPTRVVGSDVDSPCDNRRVVVAPTRTPALTLSGDAS